MRRRAGAPTGTGDSPVRDPSSLTLDDVARVAGVSAATVTRALRGFSRVAPVTRARVQEAARTLGYVPNLGARALATQSTQTIGLLIPSTADNFWGEVAAGLEERASAAGLALLLATSNGDAGRERAMIEMLVGKRVEGIVVGGAAGMPAEWFPRGRPAIPLVLVNWDTAFETKQLVSVQSEPVATMIRRIERRVDAAPFPHIRTDDSNGAAQAVRHLWELGHREIGYVGLQPIRPSMLRLLGVRRALAEHECQPTMIIECPNSLEGGEAAGRQILQATRRCTAVVAFDDAVAFGIIRAIHAAGYSVPRDLSVVGFDDVQLAAFVEPPLTSVRQAKHQLGSLAVDAILAGQQAGGQLASTLLRGELVVRLSTASPPRPSCL